jgi:hypothetical protein
MGGEGCGTALERSRFGAEGLKHRQKLAGAAIATLPGVPLQPDPDPGRLGRRPSSRATKRIPPG